MITLLIMLTAAFSMDCDPAREYITSLEYLIHQKYLELPEEEARILARKSITACSEGVAGRFIHTSQMLMTAGLSSKNALEQAITVAAQGADAALLYSELFINAFREDHLNLDLETSLNLAKTLLAEFPKTTLEKSSYVRDDIRDMTRFCMQEITLPKADCLQLAADIAAKSWIKPHRYAPEFSMLFQYLRNDDPHLAMHDALHLTTEVMLHGPGAAESFTTAYSYGVKHEHYPSAKALDFARALLALEVHR